MVYVDPGPGPDQIPTVVVVVMLEEPLTPRRVERLSLELEPSSMVHSHCYYLQQKPEAFSLPWLLGTLQLAGSIVRGRLK